MNENQFGVVLEIILDKVNGIAEGQKVMQESFEHRFETLEHRFESLEHRVEHIETDVKIIKNYVISIEDGINDHERRITVLEKKAAIK